MEPLYIIAVVLLAIILFASGFGLGEKSKRKECEQLSVSLCDAYDEIQNSKVKIQNSKKAFWQLSREYVELSNANKLMRKANEEIAKEEFEDGYKKGFREGDKIGYERAWKEVSDELIKDSIIKKNGNIVTKVSVPHHLVNVKC